MSKHLSCVDVNQSVVPHSQRASACSCDSRAASQRDVGAAACAGALRARACWQNCLRGVALGCVHIAMHSYSKAARRPATWQAGRHDSHKQVPGAAKLAGCLRLAPHWQHIAQCSMLCKPEHLTWLASSTAAMQHGAHRPRSFASLLAQLTRPSCLTAMPCASRATGCADIAARQRTCGVTVVLCQTSLGGSLTADCTGRLASTQWKSRARSKPRVAHSQPQAGRRRRHSYIKSIQPACSAGRHKQAWPETCHCEITTFVVMWCSCSTPSPRGCPFPRALRAHGPCLKSMHQMPQHQYLYALV